MIWEKWYNIFTNNMNISIKIEKNIKTNKINVIMDKEKRVKTSTFVWTTNNQPENPEQKLPSHLWRENRTLGNPRKL